MRHMSFSKTTEQMRAGTKTQTRRLGWSKLRVGARLLAVEKGQGLRKGETVRPLYEIEVTAVRREPLEYVTPADVALEGFPGMTPKAFIKRFFGDCSPSILVTVITFRRVG